MVIRVYKQHIAVNKDIMRVDHQLFVRKSHILRFNDRQFRFPAADIYGGH